MTAETDIAAVDTGGLNTAAELRTALTSVLARADLSSFTEVFAGEDIQAAMNSAKAQGGGSVVLGPGLHDDLPTLQVPYKVNLVTLPILNASEDTLVYQNGTKDQIPTILKLANGVNGPLMESAHDGPQAAGSSNFSMGSVIGGFGADGNKANNAFVTPMGLIDMVDVQGLRLVGLNVWDSDDYGIRVNSSTTGEILDCKSFFNINAGLRIDGTDITVRGGEYARNTGEGIRINGSVGIKLEGPIVFNNSGGIDVRVDTTNRFKMNGGTCGADTAVGLELKGVCTEAAVVGVQITASDVGLRLASTGGTGPSRNTFVGNTIHGADVGANSIVLQGDSHDNTFVGNDLIEGTLDIAATAHPNYWIANPGAHFLADELGVESLQLLDPSDGDTAFLIRRNVGGSKTIEQVSLGAVDSGGSGFKVLRVPN